MKPKDQAGVDSASVTQQQKKMESQPDKTEPQAAKKLPPPSKRYANKRCGDNSGPLGKNGKPCRRWALKGRDRCRWHSGSIPRGEDHPNFVHGKRSAHMPASLAKLFDDANTDTELMKLRQDVQLVEALMRSLTGRLKDGRPVPLATEKRVLDLVEQRRKLLDSEARRMRDLQLMISADRAVRMQMQAATITAEVIRELCAKHGEDATQWLVQVRVRYDRLRLPPAIVETNEGGDDENG